jgi:hypothetical protein
MVARAALAAYLQRDCGGGGSGGGSGQRVHNAMEADIIPPQWR